MPVQAQLFERDDYGADVMKGLTPWPQTPEACNTLFNRSGDMFADVFDFARLQGVHICLGVETPFWVPDELREHLTNMGKDPDDPKVRQELSLGMMTPHQKVTSCRLFLDVDA